jgi:hypothetical protein
VTEFFSECEVSVTISYRVGLSFNYISLNIKLLYCNCSLITSKISLLWNVLLLTSL